MSLVEYIRRADFVLDVGFAVSSQNVLDAVDLTNSILTDLPASLYRCLDYKTISAMVGSIYCDALASRTNCIVNPIEKGHPDLIPASGANASEEELRNYPRGLEVKCTVGNVEQGANLRAGVQRIGRLTAITWQAHHREVSELMGLAWDFFQVRDSFMSPGITAVLYSDDLETEDWGEISGTTGRNTKVTGMRTSGKKKMGEGWVILLNEESYLKSFNRLLGTPKALFSNS